MIARERIFAQAAMIGEDAGMSAVAIAQGLILIVEAYAAVGAAAALAFLAVGIARVPPAPSSVTLGARALLLPAALTLWPLILRRWIASGRRQ
jgi:hypothetical protein